LTTLQGLAVKLWGTEAPPLPAFSGERPLAVLDVTVPSQALWVLGHALVGMIGLHFFFRASHLGKVFRPARSTWTPPGSAATPCAR
jgi:branched-chain amino acid transport system permease protein